MNPDPWLDPWLPLIAERAGALPILELGCGSGQDTAVLAAAGHHVVAIDLSPSSIAKARTRVPSCEFHCQDVRDSFPAAAASVNVVIASLSLHYFAWTETEILVRRIHAALQPAGLLLCRLNSTNDHHYGASGHPAIEKNYFLVNGEPKRFFDRDAVEGLFASGWKMRALEEKIVRRYTYPKRAWEAILEKLARP